MLPALARSLPEIPTTRLVQLPGRHGDAVRQRLTALATALDLPGHESATPPELVRLLENRLAAADPDELWLSIAVLTAALPEAPDVVRAVRACRMEGAAHLLRSLFAGGWIPRLLGSGPDVAVEVITDRVIVDLDHTSRTALATGIQRVARMTSQRWSRDHDVVLVGWRPGQQALRRLHPHEAARALTGSTQGLDPDDRQLVDTIVVPWRSTYVLPELAPERDRTRRLLALAKYSRSRTGVIGFDCVPISSAETTDVNVSEAFANNLAAVRHFDRVAAISEAAAAEYRGWRHMLSAIGEPGPDVTPVALPVEPHDPGPSAITQAQDALLIGSLPLVLCVGTHEPRKNHLAVLHAAEVLWRRGVRFNLVFIGGHSWNSQRFDATVARLRSAGWPVQTLTSITDETLWAAYRVSHCLVFPSLNEGFGLPVAEALSCGTPVVTSDFGSMAEIAAHGGAVLVDPRDDDSIATGLESVLTDEALYASLRTQAAARPVRTWDEYAQETWSLLVGEGAHDA